MNSSKFRVWAIVGVVSLLVAVVGYPKLFEILYELGDRRAAFGGAAILAKTKVFGFVVIAIFLSTIVFLRCRNAKISTLWVPIVVTLSIGLFELKYSVKIGQLAFLDSVVFMFSSIFLQNIILVFIFLSLLPERANNPIKKIAMVTLIGTMVIGVTPIVMHLDKFIWPFLHSLAGQSIAHKMINFYGNTIKWDGWQYYWALQDRVLVVAFLFGLILTLLLYLPRKST